jgi:sterol 3beta-glucosyltransferase
LIGKRKLGVHIPFKKFTARKLLEAIERTQTFAIRRNVLNTGEFIDLEVGVKTTVDTLEDYFNDRELL